MSKVNGFSNAVEEKLAQNTIKIKVKLGELAKATSKTIEDFKPVAEKAGKVMDKKYNPRADFYEGIKEIQPNTVSMSDIVNGTFKK